MSTLLYLVIAIVVYIVIKSLGLLTEVWFHEDQRDSINYASTTLHSFIYAAIWPLTVPAVLLYTLWRLIVTLSRRHGDDVERTATGRINRGVWQPSNPPPPPVPTNEPPDPTGKS